ncbi:MAG: hypothetical protein ABSF43_00380 [Rectinemataceae bacterium]
MPQMIHYQDDLFSLSVLVKSLDLILSTETDPDYFAERVGTDIEFLDRSLRVFGSLLEQNTLLIERAEYLKLLERTVKSFLGVLDRLSGSGYPRAQSFAGEGQRLGAAVAEQRALLRRLVEILRSSLAEDAETELVSQDELSELLKE